MKANVEIIAQNTQDEIKASITLMMQISAEKCLEIKHRVCGFVNALLTSENVMNIFGLHCCTREQITNSEATSNDGDYMLKVRIGENKIPVGVRGRLRSEEEIRATDTILSLKVQYATDED